MLDLQLAHRRTLKVPLTPLIDVVFILLLFFMLSSTFVRYQQIEFRSIKGGSKPAPSESARVVLLSDSLARVNGYEIKVDSNEFREQLTTWARERKKVTLTSAPDVQVQNVIEVLDSLRSAGVSQLNLSESLKQ